MKTLGSLVDELQIVNLKMWNAQEGLYEIRRMTFEEFKEKYANEEGYRIIYDTFKKSCDLNVQRANITDEIDQYLIDALQALKEGTLNFDMLIKRKHKTY